MPPITTDPFFTIIQSDFMAIAVFKDRHILWANRATHRLYGYDFDQLIGQATRVFYQDQETYEAFGLEFYAQIAKNGSYNGTVMQRRKDGSIGWFEFNASPHGNRPGEVIAAIIDRTARYQLQTQLEQSEARYRALVEDQTEVITRFLPDGTILYTNEVFSRLFDQTAEALIGKRWQPVAHPDDISTVEAKLREMSPTHPVVTIENRVYTAGGELRWMQFVNRGFFDAQGSLREIQAIGRDITNLKQTELRLRALVEASSDVVYRMNADWTSIEYLLGRDFISNPDESRGSWLQQYVPSEEQERVTNAIAAAIQAKGVFELTHQIIRSDGSRGWTSSRAIPILDANGAIVEWFGMAKDITERRLAAAKLRESEERYRVLVETTSVVTWNCPPDGLQVVPQLSWMAFTGQTADDTLGAGWAKAVHPDDAASALLNWNESVAQDRPFFGEYRVRHHDGGWRWMRVRGVPVRDDAGRTVEWVGMGQDITEMKLAELSLRESEERLELALAGSGLVFWDWDLEKDQVLTSPRIQQMLGYFPEEMNSFSSWQKRLDPRDSTKVERALNTHLEGDSALFDVQHRLCHKDGHWVMVETRGKVIRRNEQGQPLRMVGTLLDITQRKRLHEEGVELLQRIETMIREATSNSPTEDIDKSALESLTKRECEVLGMIASGMTSAEIGKQLRLATNTVNVHRQNLMSKLDLHSTAELTRFAIRHNLICSARSHR